MVWPFALLLRTRAALHEECGRAVRACHSLYSTTSLTSSSSFRGLLASGSYLIDEVTSRVPLREVPAPLPLDDSLAVRTPLPSCDPGVTQRENCYLH